ncbi:hypothetical protein [Methanosarcina horonobensis]|uniref:hypothetical protein n=1 Tax=Methanosarcina horonobensis TaxID=418008 RepID=UPI000AF3EF69|nr:hypothetical protein [Methanosarcina horonobensis]
MAGNPLKVQIEYTDAKGERITVDKEVELEITGGSMPAQGKRASSNSGTSYLPYIAVIMLAGGAFVYRKKIQERIQAQRQKKPGNKKPEVSKKPEEQNSGLKAPRD